MDQDKPQPSDDLIRKVTQIASIRAMARPRYRGKFNQFGLLVTTSEIQVRKRTINTFRVSGKVFSKLVFNEVWDGSARHGPIVKKYKPGDWEKKLDQLYEFAENFRVEHRNDPDVFPPDTLV